MKQLLLTSAALAAAAFAIPSVASAHGGKYTGPGDVVPPGGGGGGGGGAPAPSGPTSPGGPGPSGPAAPGSGGPAQPGPSGGSTGPTTGPSGQAGPDLSVWTFWWEFNKEPYLDLRSHIHSGGSTTGSDDFFLGTGEADQSKDSLRPSEAQIRQQIVPALLRALETETNNDIVTGSLVALAKIGDEETTEAGESEFEKVIAPFLADSVQEISETAAVALGILANDKSIQTLADLVMDTPEGRKLVGSTEVNYRTRAFAAFGLGLIGARTASEERRVEIAGHLYNAITADESAAHDVRVAALVAMGLVNYETDTVEVADGETVDPWASRTTMIDALLGFLAEERNYHLARAHVPVTVARLLNGISDPDLKRTVKEEVVAPTMLELVDKHSKAEVEVVQSAVVALGLIGDQDDDRVDTEIRDALANPKDFPVSDQQAERFSYIALAHAAGNEGTPGAELEDTLKGALKHLRSSLGAKNVDERAWVALAIGVLGEMLNSQNRADVLQMGAEMRSKLAGAKNPSEISAFAISAGITRDLESAELLRDKLETIKDDEARGYLCLGLGLMGDPLAMEPIQKIIAESKYRPDLLRQAAIAMGILGDKELVPQLVQMLEDSTNLATQASISTALGYIGDSRSIEPLVAMLGDSSITERARGFAAVALGIVAEKETLPWNTKIAVDLNYRAATPTLVDTGGLGIVNIL